MSPISERELTDRHLKYVEVADSLRRRIAAGELLPGDQLPSFARMFNDHGIGQGTIERAYQLLERDKLVVRQARKGTFVALPGVPRRRATIGVVWSYVGIGEPCDEPYVAEMLLGTHRAALKNNIEVLFLDEHGSLSADRVDGAILHGSTCADKIDLPPGMPHVSIGIERPGSHCLISDDGQGIRDAVNHLLDLGHRRIAYLGVGGQSTSDEVSRRRLAAYLQALLDRGITPDPAWQRPLFVEDDWIHGWESFRDFGRLRMTAWLQSGWTATGCTAILGQNDDAAIGIIEALHEAGLNVPADISVVGFDGTARIEYFSPRLTTVRVPLMGLCVAAVDLLAGHFAAAAGGEPAPAARCEWLATTLCVGESSSPPPNSHALLRPESKPPLAQSSARAPARGPAK